MSDLKYHTGNIFELMWKTKNPKNLAIIPHVCNVQGAWGAGFVLAISKVAPPSLGPGRSPEAAYKLWKKHHDAESKWQKNDIFLHAEGATISNPFELGEIQVCTIGLENGIKPTDFDKYFEVVNMIAQDGFRGVKSSYRRPVRYGKLAMCMEKLAELIQIRMHSEGEFWGESGEIHCPKFGAGLGGGNWGIIEELICDIWVDNGIDVHVYDY